MRAECREQVAKALGKRKLSAADSNRISSLYIRAQNTLARTDPDWMFKSPAERAEAGDPASAGAPRRHLLLRRNVSGAAEQVPSGYGEVLRPGIRGWTDEI